MRLPALQYRPTSQSSPVTVLLHGPGSNLFILRLSSVLQEAVVKAIFRNKVLHVLDPCWCLCRWGWLCGQQVPFMWLLCCAPRGLH